MFNGLSTNPQISIQCLDFGWKNRFFQGFVMCSTIQVHESGRVGYGLNLWDSYKI